MLDRYDIWIAVLVLFGGAAAVALLIRSERRARQSLEVSLVSSSSLIVVCGFVMLIALAYLLGQV